MLLASGISGHPLPASGAVRCLSGAQAQPVQDVPATPGTLDSGKNKEY